MPQPFALFLIAVGCEAASFSLGPPTALRLVLQFVALAAIAGCGVLLRGEDRSARPPVLLPRERLQLWTRAIVVIGALALAFGGLTDILNFHNGVFVLIGMDTVGMLLYTEFIVGVISDAWLRRYAHRTPSAITAGVLVSFVGVLVLFAATYFVLGTQWHGEIAGGGAGPGIQNRIDAMYFAATVFTTVGFGDIHAQGDLARLVVTGQMLFTYAYAVSGLALVTTVSFGGATGGRNRDHPGAPPVDLSQ